MHAPELDFEHFYNEHLPPLVELARSNACTTAEAERLAHEVLLASLLHLPKIQNLRAWLAGSLRCAIRRNEGA